MVSTHDAAADWGRPRPIPDCYWIRPGRLLAGAHPGSRSRADAMDRLRRFLAAGVTCFVDLTEPSEMPSYEVLLPFASPDGTRVEYLREPIPDHGVPASAEVMARVIELIDSALDAGHLVYVHCRAGIGRSATVAGCWLADRDEGGRDPLLSLQELWRQSSVAARWPEVPETEEQALFVRRWWQRHAVRPSLPVSEVRGEAVLASRVRGALLGLALGDAMGAAVRNKVAFDGRWTQHTALALCLAESLLERGGHDARDQIERYLRWQRSGHCAASGEPSEATEDVARALANYLWRHQAVAGSHDPHDRSANSLPRVVAAVAYEAGDPAAAVTLAGQSSRTTHPSPVIVDACRYLGALLFGAMQGTDPFAGAAPFQPTPGLWSTRPLRKEVLQALSVEPAVERAAGQSKLKGKEADVLEVVAGLSRAVADGAGFEPTLQRALAKAPDPALTGAVIGALLGALGGAQALPPESIARLARRDLIEQFASRLAACHSPLQERSRGGAA